MAENEGDTTTTTATSPPPPQQQLSFSSPKDTPSPTAHQQPSPAVVVFTGAPFVPAPLYVPSSPFDHQQFDQTVNPKRPRYGATSTGTSTVQWKLLPSSASSQQQTQTQTATTTESNPSPTANPKHQTAAAATASSSDTASSPSHSPLPRQETTKQETEQHHQFRKGKYVSPVWKPNEMLWLARAWRVQYLGDGSSESSSAQVTGGGVTLVTPSQSTRGKTRADKDREVAEFLNRHGVNRDAKTAGTKWDNMLGEFRKVYEWERGGESDGVGKSYFRLSPYERKIHRLPASFEEEVFEELAQFMGSRMRTSTVQSRGGAGVAAGSLIGSVDDIARNVSRALPPPPPSKEEDLSLSGRTKQLVTTLSGRGEGGYFHGSGRGSSLGFETASSSDVVVAAGGGASLSKELRRIGKIKMTWEESVSLWAEEGEHHRGRVRLQGSSFLNADELTFFDDSMVACTMEVFEDGPLKGFSIDKFVSGQQVKFFGRRKVSSSADASVSLSGFERVQLPLTEPPVRSIPPFEFQDPTEYLVGSLRVPPTTLPSLLELSWYLLEPPPEELRFPLRKDVYRDLPPGKELFFTTSPELLDCRGITYDVISSLIRTNPSVTTGPATAASRDSFIGVWDGCINGVVCKFCSNELVMVRKPSSSNSAADTLQDQWPNVTGFVRNFCLWRGEEADQLREGQIDPSNSIVEKLLWTYLDLPYILGYHAVGYIVTFCALSRSQDRVIRTDLCSLDLSSPAERLKALVPCYRVAGLLPLLADRCFNNSGGTYKQLIFSDFERVDMGNGNIMEMTPNTVIKLFSSKRKWAAVKEIYDVLEHRIPHSEFLHRSSEKDLGLVFKPRGVKFKPSSCDQLVEALKYVTKALVALHDSSYMHRDLSWDKVMRRSDRENEWFVSGFDDAAAAPQLYPQGGIGEARGRHAPEMGRGLHGVKVDVWGVGYLVKTCGLGPNSVPKMLRELQDRCLDQNPEQRPTAADCYRHLLQVQSSLQPSPSGGPY